MAEKTGKSGPLVETDLEFLGYHNVNRETAEGWGLQRQICRVFTADTQAGIDVDTHWFVYLLTECRDEDIQRVESAVLSKEEGIFAEDKCYIVIPESMSGRNALKKLQDRRRVRVFEDLMWGKVQQTFSEYIREDEERIKGLQANPYVEPQVKNERDDNILSLRNLSNMLSDKRTNESITVIKADAGVGKTTLAAKVASELVKQWTQSRVVPLLLTGQADWRELTERARNANNLGDILISLLMIDETDFPLRSIEQFTRIMQLGYFAFIFDGFDELTKPSGGASLPPQENFDWLANIATDSNARIMLTTRHSFWDREISSETAKKHEILSLQPFDSKSVSEYFKQYFSEKKNRGELTQKAQRFYSELKKSQGDNATEDSFFNLPACAMMIADQVEKSGDIDVVADKPTHRNPSRELFMQILRRENIRQQTGIEDLKTMHEVFENTAISLNEFDLDDIATDPICEIQPENIKKIADHAFFKAKDSDSDPGKLVFKNDFLFHYLRASYIHRFILEETNQSFEEYRANRDLRKLVDSEADGSGHLSEQVSRYLDMSDMDKVVDLHKACANKEAFGHSLKSFLFHIIAKTVISRRKSESRRERGDTILSLLGDKKTRCVSNLHIRGELDGIYLSNWEIRDSSFVDFSLEKGDSQGDLKFIGCDFSGTLSLPDDLGFKSFENCTSSGPAKLFLNKIGLDKITEEETRKHLRAVLRRFWRGPAKVRSMSENHWKTGVTVAIERSYNLLEILKQEEVVVKEHEHRSRPQIQIDPDSINDVKEFMENGIVKGRVQTVLERMNEKVNRKK